jgi:hypothetical protein
MSAEKKTTVKPMLKENLAPKSILLRMHLPRLSVPRG